MHVEHHARTKDQDKRAADQGTTHARDAILSPLSVLLGCQGKTPAAKAGLNTKKLQRFTACPLVACQQHGTAAAWPGLPIGLMLCYVCIEEENMKSAVHVCKQTPSPISASIAKARQAKHNTYCKGTCCDVQSAIQRAKRQIRMYGERSAWVCVGVGL